MKVFSFILFDLWVQMINSLDYWLIYLPEIYLILVQIQEMGNCDSKHKKGLSHINEDDGISQARKYQLLGNYEQATKLYYSSIKDKGASPEAYTGLGNISSYQGRYQNAIQYYEKALNIDQTYKFALNGMGNSYDALEMDQEAVQAYNRALKIDPDFAFAHNGIGNFYYARRDFQSALPHYESAEEADPENPLIHANIACCLIYLGKLERSFGEFEKTREMAANKQELSEPNKIYLNEKLKQFKDELKKFKGKKREELLDRIKRSMEDAPLGSNQNVQDRIHQILKA